MLLILLQMQNEQHGFGFLHFFVVILGEGFWGSGGGGGGVLCVLNPSTPISAN